MSIPLSVPQQPCGPAADGLLRAGTSCARARAWRWRDICSLPGTASHPATAVCPCQKEPSALPSDPCPSQAARTSLLCFPLLACSLPPQALACSAPGCSHRGGCPAGTVRKGNGEFWRGQGMEELWAGETRQEYRLLGSFSAFPLAHQLCPGIRELNALNHKGTGHPWHKVIYPSSWR